MNGPPRPAEAGRFVGKVALVTGAARGIGREVAACLLREGARVLAADSDAAALAAAFAPAEDVRAVALDVASSASVAECVARELADTPLHLLVNNAGIVRDAWLGNMSDAAFDEVLAVNLRGPFLCTRAALPALKRAQRAAVVNVASRAMLGNPGQSAYSASKAGLVGLTRTLALELARFGIRVNAVAPGLIDTPMVRALPEDVRHRLLDLQPTREMGTARDVANAVLFLGSAESAFVTGQVVMVDGGRSVGLLPM